MSVELDLVGRVAVRILKAKLDAAPTDAGLARFLVHGLAKDEVVALVEAVLADADLSPRLDVRLPRYRYGDIGFPEPLLTDLTTTDLRHLECDREGRLLVLADDSQMQSLAQVEKLDADVLMDEDHADDWIAACREHVTVSEEVVELWRASLRGLLRLDRTPLRKLAGYVYVTASAMGEGDGPALAFGRHLPRLGIPRHDRLFEDMPAKRERQPSLWLQRYDSHWRRESYVAKRDTSQVPLSRASLRTKLEKLRGEMREDLVGPLQAYVEAQEGVSEASIALFRHDWSDLKPFFEEVQKAEGRSLGQETRDFFEDKGLGPEDLAYLEALKGRGADPDRHPEDEAFYAARAQELREAPRLAALWERFVFGPSVECSDLLDGIAQCLRRSYHPSGRAQTLVVEGVQRAPASFNTLDVEACDFFATAHRGLREHLDGVVEFRQALAFDFAGLREGVKARQKDKPPKGRRSRQLAFKVWLETRSPEDIPEKGPEFRLVWEHDGKGIGSGVVRDLDRLRTNASGSSLVRCVTGRPERGGRNDWSTLDLDDTASFEPPLARDRGYFVPASSRCKSLAKDWKAGLVDVLKRGYIPKAVEASLRDRFAAFEEAYAKAIEDRIEVGVVAPTIPVQAALYGALVNAILAGVSAPVGLELLLRPLLEVGVANVDGLPSDRQVSVTCPWHPLRLAARAARWESFGARIRGLLAPDAPGFTDDGGLFFADLRRFLAEPLAPEVVVGWGASMRVVLTASQSRGDYTLNHSPEARSALGVANADVAGLARQVVELLNGYVKLQPHERDNLSVVLYNCDDAALPQRVADAVRADAEREGTEAHCRVVVRHRDDDQLGRIYQGLVSAGVGEGAQHASEADDEFVSRVQVTFMTNEAAPLAGVDGPPLDIVFCHDVISRAAGLDWLEVARATKPFSDIDPGQWSRRRPIGRGERDAVMYLFCPVQPPEGWAYMDAVGTVHDPGRARRAREAGMVLAPTRQTNVQDPSTRAIIDETHALGSWVVNFDDLLDRRQLLDNEIRVIRYKHAVVGGRNLVISSRAPDALLRVTLKARLRALDPDYAEEELDAVSVRLIQDANTVSGDIVLRAARRANNASELIGVVLSRFLVDAEIGRDARATWIFLDDYAAWLGQAEGRIADLLCLWPSVDADGEPVLTVVVTEAKYVAAVAAGPKAAESARQLADTLSRLEAALTTDEATADRGIWLARLSDMLVDGLRDPDGLSGPGGQDWRALVREGKCRVVLKGYSHVFAHAPPAAGGFLVEREDRIVPRTTSGRQQVYGPDLLRQLLRRYAGGGNPSDLREGFAEGETALRDLALRPHGGTAAPRASRRRPSPRSEDAPAPAEPAVAPGITRSEPRAVEPEPAAEALTAPAVAGPADPEAVAWLDDAAVRCRMALQGYGMSARLEQKVLTPNAGLLKFKGSNELTVAAVERKAQELETTHALKVLSVRAEPGRVTVSVRRPRRATLRITDVWGRWERTPGEPNNRILVGVCEDDGSLLFLEPERAPHTLVAGSTGSGKSVLVQNILLGIAATNTPGQARITLIDPKSGVDYFSFEELPHLDGPIVDQSDEAIQRLEATVAEMERRYALFKAARVKDLRGYNRNAAEPLPVLWLVHDEFADWMQIDDYREGVEAAVTRLGVKARAAGIYLVFAAQRPDNGVFPMQLRSNLGNRLVLRVDGPGTSDISLGIKGGGAERLLGHGHMAAILGGGTEPVFAQVPYVDEEELSGLVAAIRDGTLP